MTEHVLSVLGHGRPSEPVGAIHADDSGMAANTHLVRPTPAIVVSGLLNTIICTNVAIIVNMFLYLEIY